MDRQLLLKEGRGLIADEIGFLEKFDLFQVKLSHKVSESDPIPDGISLVALIFAVSRPIEKRNFLLHD